MQLPCLQEKSVEQPCVYARKSFKKLLTEQKNADKIYICCGKRLQHELLKKVQKVLDIDKESIQTFMTAAANESNTDF